MGDTLRTRDWESLIREPAVPPKRVSGVWPVSWPDLTASELATVGVAPGAHPHATLEALGCAVDDEPAPDWAIAAYERAATAILIHAGKVPARDSVDAVMRELILPRAVAMATPIAELSAANPYVEFELLLRLYVSQRGGSGPFPAVR